MSNGRRQQPVVFVAGATGCGKSDAALSIAHHLRSDWGYAPVAVINCDALQFYQGLPIATNKLSKGDATLHSIVKATSRAVSSFTADAGTASSSLQTEPCTGKSSVDSVGSVWTVPHFFMDFLDSEGNMVADPATDVFASDERSGASRERTKHDERESDAAAGIRNTSYTVSRFEADASLFIATFFAALLNLYPLMSYIQHRPALTPSLPPSLYHSPIQATG